MAIWNCEKARPCRWLERAEEDEDLRGEIREAGQADGGEGGEAEGEAEDGHRLREAAEFCEGEGAGALADLAGDGEEGGDGEAVGEHEERRAGQRR